MSCSCDKHRKGVFMAKTSGMAQVLDNLNNSWEVNPDADYQTKSKLNQSKPWEDS